MIGQQIVNGIVTGSVYALFALGFNLVLGALNILNVAQGAVFTWSAFVGFYLIQNYGVPFPVALLAAVAAGGVLNMLIEIVVFRPLRAAGGNPMTTLVASIGVSMVLVSVAQIASDAQVERFPAGALPESSWSAFGLQINFMQLTVLLATAAMVAGTYLLLHHTRLGKAIRSVAFSERNSKMLGIPTESVARWTFFISGALGGLAGVLLGVMFSTVHFLMGEPYVLKGFAAIVIGGFGSVIGVIIASMMLGLAEVFSTVIGLGAFRDVITFGMLFSFLLLRPNGLFGKDEEARP